MRRTNIQGIGDGLACQFAVWPINKVDLKGVHYETKNWIYRNWYYGYTDD
jgi:hypothetical protein